MTNSSSMHAPDMVCQHLKKKKIIGQECLLMMLLNSILYYKFNNNLYFTAIYAKLNF